MVSDSVPDLASADGPIRSKRHVATRYIASGAWGIVYQGFDKLLDKDIVLKVLCPIPLAVEQARRRGKDVSVVLLEEATRIPPGDYSHLVSRDLHYDENGVPYLTMEWYDQTLATVLGDTLASASRRNFYSGSLSLDKLLEYSLKIVQATREFHDVSHCAHCDMGASNFMVRLIPSIDEEVLRLTDPGSATISSPSDHSAFPRSCIGNPLVRHPVLFFKDSRTSFYTGGGILPQQKVDELYIADPELIRIHPVFKTDLFSVGAIIHRMVTGAYPLEELLRPVLDRPRNGFSLEEFEVLAAQQVEEVVKRYIHHSELTDDFDILKEEKFLSSEEAIYIPTTGPDRKTLRSNVHAARPQNGWVDVKALGAVFGVENVQRLYASADAIHRRVELNVPALSNIVRKQWGDVGSPIPQFLQTFVLGCLCGEYKTSSVAENHLKCCLKSYADARAIFEYREETEKRASERITHTVEEKTAMYRTQCEQLSEELKHSRESTVNKSRRAFALGAGAGLVGTIALLALLSRCAPAHGSITSSSERIGAGLLYER